MNQRAQELHLAHRGSLVCPGPIGLLESLVPEGRAALREYRRDVANANLDDEPCFLHGGLRVRRRSAANVPIPHARGG
jgi:hypothetical protein